ncbi:hypothetical protein H206_01706 [Candidatus Electrothrix aarhusensis]|uniref:Uncharacterized protein n=1 Tax=Candidatus Electrothrix aarhusensis TaxID=1859131 RepID=A0A3S3QH98_9BACT|nr:hypothetical protein H206_01706 [Candidatus Electrothrix aarhusensis]
MQACTTSTVRMASLSVAFRINTGENSIKSGRTPWSNLFIAGTDQGYLGIVGAMLSGVTIVNQHLL